MWLKDVSSSHLRSVVDIISYTTELDDDGIPVDKMEVEYSVRCKVNVPSLRRQEALIGQGIDVTNTLMFVIRYIPNLDSEIHKIRYRDRVYEIVGMEDVEERQIYWNLLCEVKK